MAVSPVFEWVSSELQRRTPLSRLEARGTVRLLLKQAGLEPGSVTAAQMDVANRRLMPAALKVRGIDDADSLSTELAPALARAAAEHRLESAESAYDVFERLGGHPPPEKKK